MDKIDQLRGVGACLPETTVYLPASVEIRQMIYFHPSPGNVRKIGDELWRSLRKDFSRKGAGLVMFEVEDWNHDLSPWPAERIFREGEGFAGGGRDYLEDLCGQVIPEIEGRYAEISYIQRRAIGGYSMGGLFALYALLKSPLFTDLISVSGSLWYEGIVEYISERAGREGKVSGLQEDLRREEEYNRGRGRAYFSLGQREPKTRNPVMRRVGEQTAAIVELMKEWGFCVHFEWNPGNHFRDELGRMERAIRYMLDGSG